MADDSARISPTAHYTSFVWFAHGLSHPALATGLGRTLYRLLWPCDRLYRQLRNRAGLVDNLLARHRLIDAALRRAIEAGRVGQVLEVACGLSPRGFKFARRYPELRYVEADLAAMAGDKRRRLERAGLLQPNHRIEVVDALRDDGPDSLARLAAHERVLGRQEQSVAEVEQGGLQPSQRRKDSPRCR